MLLLTRVGLEIQGCRVDAVAHAGLVSRTVFKEMTQVPTTAGADNLFAYHTMAGIPANFDISFTDDIPKARPAGSGMKLGVRGEKHVSTAGAFVCAVVLGFDELSRERPLGSRFPKDLIRLQKIKVKKTIWPNIYFIHGASVEGEAIFDKEINGMQILGQAHSPISEYYLVNKGLRRSANAPGATSA